MKYQFIMKPKSLLTVVYDHAWGNRVTMKATFFSLTTELQILFSFVILIHYSEISLLVSSNLTLCRISKIGLILNMSCKTSADNSWGMLALHSDGAVIFLSRCPLICFAFFLSCSDDGKTFIPLWVLEERVIFRLSKNYKRLHNCNTPRLFPLNKTSDCHSPE